MGKKTTRKKSSRKGSAFAQPKNSGGILNSKIVLAIIITLLTSVFGAAAIGIWKINSGPEEASSNTIKFPSFVTDRFAPKDTPKAYQASVDYYEDFSKIPCYCGCGQHNGHTSLQSCFISSKTGDQYKFGEHGAG